MAKQRFCVEVVCANCGIYEVNMVKVTLHDGKASGMCGPDVETCPNCNSKDVEMLCVISRPVKPQEPGSEKFS